MSDPTVAAGAAPRPSLSRRLPSWMFPSRLEAWSDDAWALAAAGRVAAVVIYLIGYVVLILDHAGDFGFRTFLQALFAKNFLIASPATLVAVAAIGLRRERWAQVSARGQRLAEGGLVGAAVLAAICIVGSVIAFIATLPDLDHFGFAFQDLMIDVAALIAAVTAGIWALVELDHRRAPTSG
ncbi:MAG: hypothetical protein QOE20_5470 [Mycobacterium sp.]|nr:hypothetical protein [Mycobacterium sp.]